MLAIGMPCRAIRQAAHAIALCLGLLVPPGASAEAPSAPQTGLLWNKSGLPATFPLLVMTPPDHAYHLTLKDAATGADILAAYIVGGEFFQVLVPPGTFTLHFEQGTTWQGKTELFGDGPDTASFTLASPLTFEIRGFGVKGGHKVDLRSRAAEARDAEISPRSICQSVSLEFDEPEMSPFEREYVPTTRVPTPEDPWRVVRNGIYETEAPNMLFELDPLRLRSRHLLQGRICD
ncbi:hypothetical protein [Pelagivirga sediminicola]|nr:hypothetical protein [Pelagivirga sediminicola]